MKRANRNIEVENRVRISVITSLLLTLLLNFIRLYNIFSKESFPNHIDEKFSYLREHLYLDTFLHFLSTFLTAIAVFSVFYALKHMKLYIRISISIILGFILSIVFLYLHMLILHIEDLIHPMMGVYFFRTLLVLATVFITTLAAQLTEQKRKATEERERLNAENLRTQFEVLKNQLNPHFLFNSLSTLTSLISPDNIQAQEYVHTLSDVLRYTLQKRDILPLKDELEFAHSYCHLMKIRYGDSLSMQFDVDEKYYNWNIVPLGLQVLIENAIKHNVITRKQPLTISVFTTENASIVVENRIQPKLEAESGSAIGLANLNERYSLLAGKGIVITNKNDIFKVEIPLLFSEDE